MSKLNVLLLGWEFSPAIREKQETSCYFIAQALAKRVDLSVLLPHTNPNFILHNVELTGLDQVNLKSIQPNSTQLQSLPYADEAYIRNTIPLYGSHDFVSQSAGNARPVPALRTGTPPAFTKDKPGKIQGKEAEPVNIFGYKDFEALSLDAQVIEYARYTSRWANQREFDLIYAYNYRTFLAGTELKIVTGKKLILQVDSLSYERSEPNSKGWIYEVEKQAFQKCDYILTNKGDTAVILVDTYGISPTKIESLEEENGTNASPFPASGKETPNNLRPDSFTDSTINPAKAVLKSPAKEEAHWQSAADAIWEVIQMVAST